MLPRVRWRLQRDALLAYQFQSPIGELLLNLPGGTPWQTAMATYWARKDAASIEAVKQLADSGSGGESRLTDAIELLSRSESKDAKLAAIELTDRLAAELQIAAPDWYEAKWQAATWLSELGEQDQARKRAKYVLLLHRPADPELAKRFERLAN